MEDKIDKGGMIFRCFGICRLGGGSGVNGSM